jgi:hypothetical protein
MSGIGRRLASIERQARVFAQAPACLVDRPPRETREDWLARRAAGLHWVRQNGNDRGAWVLKAIAGGAI